MNLVEKAKNRNKNRIMGNHKSNDKNKNKNKNLQHLDPLHQLLVALTLEPKNHDIHVILMP